ncbi:unnamed protein product [Owenia fusiformis]|uniref:Uncharacterized protein n=1 Tax=Owenia fusiformis TaxID=6347 RepID=A0A8J1UWS7_OWEFU|nr:unnamed protein product [Owenia fusiformis]
MARTTVSSETYRSSNQIESQVDVRQNNDVVKTHTNTKTLWVFLGFGVVQIVIGFLLAVIYFSIRALTTSLEYIEVIPTYANAILIICSGVLVLCLYKRRDKIIIISAIILCIVSSVLCAAAGVLTMLRIMQTFHRFSTCDYDNDDHTCRCYTSGLNALPPGIYISEHKEYIFHKSNSCEVIQNNLVDFMYALCVLYGGGIIITMVTSGLGMIVCKNEKDQSFVLEHTQDDIHLQEAAGGLHYKSSSQRSKSSQNTIPQDEAPDTRLVRVRRRGSLPRLSSNSTDNVGNTGQPQVNPSFVPDSEHPPGNGRVNNENENDSPAVTNHIYESVAESAPHGQPVPRTSQWFSVNPLLQMPRLHTQALIGNRRSTAASWGSLPSIVQADFSPSPDERSPNGVQHRIQRHSSVNVLPRRPLQRNSSNELPPVPLSRPYNAQRRLPPQPLQRGSSMGVVDLPFMPVTRSQTRGGTALQRNISQSYPVPEIYPTPLPMMHMFGGYSGYYPMPTNHTSMNAIMMNYGYPEPPPPYFSEPPPYIENDTVPEYMSRMNSPTGRGQSTQSNDVDDFITEQRQAESSSGQSRNHGSNVLHSHDNQSNELTEHFRRFRNRGNNSGDIVETVI